MSINKTTLTTAGITIVIMAGLLRVRATRDLILG